MTDTDESSLARALRKVRERRLAAKAAAPRRTCAVEGCNGEAKGPTFCRKCLGRWMDSSEGRHVTRLADEEGKEYTPQQRSIVADFCRRLGAEKRNRGMP